MKIMTTTDAATGKPYLRIYDPEAVGNFENWGPGKTYPQYRTYSIGLDVTF